MSSNKSVLFIIITAVCFGTMEIALKFGAEDFTALQMTFLRFFIGGLFLLPFALHDIRKRKIRITKGDMLYLAALGLTGLAGGAAVAGCCAQMVGFAVMSFRENRWGGLAAQGLGTSMLQMGNIVRNPRIWIPPTLAAAITGPVATCLFRLEMNGAPVSSGMGTCGLVGQIGVYTGWVNDVASGAKAAVTGMDWLGLVLISFVLPAVLTWLIAIPLRKWGWIKDGDLKLDL